MSAESSLSELKPRTHCHKHRRSLQVTEVRRVPTSVVKMCKPYECNEQQPTPPADCVSSVPTRVRCIRLKSTHDTILDSKGHFDHLINYEGARDAVCNSPAYEAVAQPLSTAHLLEHRNTKRGVLYLLHSKQ